MRFNDLADQGESQAGASIVSRRGIIQLMELFEDIFQPVGWNADSRIGHRDNHEMLSFAFDAHHNVSVRRRKFDSVINELVQHPGDFLRIGLNERNVLIDPDLQIDTRSWACGV